MNKHFLSSQDFTPEQYIEVIELALKLKKERPIHNRVLENKSVGVYTTKPSLRTRLSFEVAISELGGNSLFIQKDEIGIGTRESHEDVANVLSRYLSCFIVRSHDQAGLEKLAQYSPIPIINALTDKEHPCQVIADLITIQETFGKLKGVKLAYIGDGNNMTHSLMIASAIVGIEFTAICPPTREPDNYYLDLACKLAEKYNNPFPVVCNDALLASTVDVVYTDVWESMGDSLNNTDLFRPYQINNELLQNKDIKVLHCLPAHKEEEISTEIFEKNKELIFNQAENRLHAQKALLFYLFG